MKERRWEKKTQTLLSPFVVMNVNQKKEAKAIVISNLHLDGNVIRSLTLRRLSFVWISICVSYFHPFPNKAHLAAAGDKTERKYWSWIWMRKVMGGKFLHCSTLGRIVWAINGKMQPRGWRWPVDHLGLIQRDTYRRCYLYLHPLDTLLWCYVCKQLQLCL